MSTNAQRSSYFDLIQSGQAISQAQAVERYLSKLNNNLADTEMVATFLNRPKSTATRCLDTLASQGKVTRVETAPMLTGWQYEPNPDKWALNRKRYLLEKVQRAIKTLDRANQEAGGVLGSNWNTFLLMDSDKIDGLINEML